MFRVFQVFQLRFWTKKPPDFGPNPNKTHKLIGSSFRHIMPAANTQKGNSPTCLRTRYCPIYNSHSFFRRSRLFYSFPSHIPLTLTFPIRENLLDSWSEINFQICGKSRPRNRTINLSQFSVLFCNFLIIVYFCSWIVLF